MKKINRDIFFVNNQYRAIFTTNNNCEKRNIVIIGTYHEKLCNV